MNHRQKIVELKDSWATYEGPAYVPPEDGAAREYVNETIEEFIEDLNNILLEWPESD